MVVLSHRVPPGGVTNILCSTMYVDEPTRSCSLVIRLIN